jgi:hypothetical protein
MGNENIDLGNAYCVKLNAEGHRDNTLDLLVQIETARRIALNIIDDDGGFEFSTGDEQHDKLIKKLDKGRSLAIHCLSQADHAVSAAQKMVDEILDRPKVDETTPEEREILRKKDPHHDERTKVLDALKKVAMASHDGQTIAMNILRRHCKAAKLSRLEPEKFAAVIAACEGEVKAEWPVKP